MASATRRWTTSRPASACEASASAMTREYKTGRLPRSPGLVNDQRGLPAHDSAHRARRGAPAASGRRAEGGSLLRSRGGRRGPWEQDRPRPPEGGGEGRWRARTLGARDVSQVRDPDPASARGRSDPPCGSGKVQELPPRESPQAVPVEKTDIEALSGRLDQVEGYLHVEEKRGLVSELEAQSASAGFWDDTAAATAVMARLNAAKDDVRAVDEARSSSRSRPAFELGEGRRIGTCSPRPRACAPSSRDISASAGAFRLVR